MNHMIECPICGCELSIEKDEIWDLKMYCPECKKDFKVTIEEIGNEYMKDVERVNELIICKSCGFIAFVGYIIEGNYYCYHCHLKKRNEVSMNER